MTEWCFEGVLGVGFMGFTCPFCFGFRHVLGGCFLPRLLRLCRGGFVGRARIHVEGDAHCFHSKRLNVSSAKKDRKSVV